jgi:hypothetical protein
MSEIRVNKVINEAGTGAVELTQGATLPSGKTLSGAGGLNITGVSTFAGNVSIGGTLTYEDVTNIDSVGVITARSGINVTGGNTTIKGAVETVNAGAYAGTELTCDTATGTGHTTAALGIGTNVTLDPTGVTAFTKAVKVGSGTTITLGTTANDVNIVTLGVHYNGGTNTDAANYNVFITKSGDFR